MGEGGLDGLYTTSNRNLRSKIGGWFKNFLGEGHILYKAAFHPSSTPRMSYSTENFHAAREIVLYLKMQILFKLSY